MEELRIMRESDGDDAPIVYEDGKAFEEWSGPHSIVNFTRRTQKPTLIPCASDDYQFGFDSYITQNRVKSVLCMPIMVKNVLKGVLYLENNLYEGLFTKHRMDLLLVLTSQMAITLENTLFFNALMKEQMAKMRLEQMTLDEERQRLRADAAEQYRFQLENFVDMICHEIRNPLNGIFGNSDLILLYIENIEAILTKLRFETDHQKTCEKELRGQVEHIRTSAGSVQICAEHQKCITDDVLQLSKLRANKLQLVNNFFYPHQLVNTGVRMFSVQAANKGLDLIVNLPDEKHDGMQVWTDGMRITQIITNIISNAVKFTPKGFVKISITLEEDIESELEKVVEHNNSDSWTTKTEETQEIDTNEITEVNGIPVQSCFLKFKVEDTGIGMTADEQSRIFTRFSQANNRTAKEYGGSGLGLSICKLLAKQMGGYLYVESTKGVGSIFYLSIHCKRATQSNGPKLKAEDAAWSEEMIDPSSRIELLNSRTEYLASRTEDPTIRTEHLASRAEDANSRTELLASRTEEAISSPGNRADDVNNNNLTVDAGRISPDKEASTKANILVVEDNNMNQLLLNRILKIKGYNVFVANNGAEGLDLFNAHAHHAPFECILMDIQMPIMDGLEATIRIRNFEKQNGLRPTLIIGLSGNARDEYKEQAIAAGMNHYITKPYHKEVLFKLLP